MTDEMNVDDVKADLATAVGLLALTGASVNDAAERAGISRWELEETLEDEQLAERLGVELDGDVASEIDSLLDDRS